MKKKLISIFAVVFALAVFAGSVSAHWDSAYWNETSRTQYRAGWMNRLNDNKKLSELSIPGTHDTMAFNSNLVHSVRTQAMNLRTQLDSGIRVLDIRVKYESSTYLSIYHGIVYLGYSLEDVLQTVQSFLQANPTEFVLLRVKQENSSASDAQMKVAFDSYYNRYKSMFYQENNYNPTVKQLRGKAVLLSDVASLHQYGIPYNNLDKQDSYHLNSNWDLYSKWEKVRVQFNKSNDNRTNSTIYMNYLSGSGGSMPYFVASGHSSPGTGADRLATALTEPGFAGWYPDFPRVNWFLCFATIAFEGTNTLTANLLNNSQTKCAGIVMADFPGERLINAVIACNDR